MTERSLPDTDSGFELLLAVSEIAVGVLTNATLPVLANGSSPKFVGSIQLDINQARSRRLLTALLLNTVVLGGLGGLWMTRMMRLRRVGLAQRRGQRLLNPEGISLSVDKRIRERSAVAAADVGQVGAFRPVVAVRGSQKIPHRSVKRGNVRIPARRNALGVAAVVVESVHGRERRAGPKGVALQPRRTL
ncbi:protein argonaute 2 [Babesia caballi]|uniref:Protein argonaute 2 n=1 Tax=Babesia caballi TaxID=5871 RepID=A0AAV4LTN1_BABCB|nr:protein argonaute 2 [Babesia caballi]